MTTQANARSITPLLPRALPKTVVKKVHAAIESHLAAVEALTTFLDEAEGDADFEPNLGAAEAGGEYDSQARAWAHPRTARQDFEDEHDGREDGGDDEPSEDPEPELGWTADVDQARASRGLTTAGLHHHGEAEHDGGEPSLGSVGSGNPGTPQEFWAAGARGDLEDEHDGREPDVEDEALLGWTGITDQTRLGAQCRFSFATDGEGPDVDQEPSLGSCSAMTNQNHWALGSTRDLEDEHDGGEPEEMI
jgi:hypothetical protein